MTGVQNCNLSHDLKPYEHQIAGHVYEKGHAGMLTCRDGTVLKPILQDPRGEREVKFYEKVFKTQDPSNEVGILRSFLPKYFGVIKLAGSKESPSLGSHFKLQNLTKNFKLPCIMDIKVGKRTWDQYASEKKIASEKSKSSLQGIIGFRLCGIKVYDNNTKNHKFYDRFFCREIATIEELQSVLIKYLEGAKDNSLKQAVLSNIITKLKDIHHWFCKQRLFSFTSSSILMIYEADCKEYDCNNRSRTAPQSCLTEVKMIDFSHVFESNDYDINYKQGIESLIHHLEECLTAIKSINVNESSTNHYKQTTEKGP